MHHVYLSLHFICKLHANTDTHICKAFHIVWGAHGVMASVVGNGHGNPSSNPW